MSVELIRGECLAELAKIPDLSIDMVLGDLPYGTTNRKGNPWDVVIPMAELWAAWKRICKPGAPIVLFTQQPFTTTVAASHLKHLRTEWIWEKPQGTGFLNCNRYPLKNHENILVFCDRTPPYHPQKQSGGKPYVASRGISTTNYGKFENTPTINTDGSRFPKTVLAFNQEKGLHPTQKPVALLEYLIRTYSNPGDTILDPTMGSGSTGVACVNTGRSFVGIERDAGYYSIAKQRIDEALSKAA